MVYDQISLIAQVLHYLPQELRGKAGAHRTAQKGRRSLRRGGVRLGERAQAERRRRRRRIYSYSMIL
jgi:hypothetical protein